MKTSAFFWNSIRWLRQDVGVQTELVPATPILDVRATLDVPGHVSRSPLPRRLAFVGLWVLSMGLVLAMTGTPALSLETRDLLRELGRMVLLGGGLLELAAFVMSRFHRDRVLVELRPAAAGPATVASLKALRGRAGDGMAWVVGERSPEPMALAAAASLGVRWFVPGGNATWREHATRPSATRSTAPGLGVVQPYALPAE